jgi:hypothetical protein
VKFRIAAPKIKNFKIKTNIPFQSVSCCFTRGMATASPATPRAAAKSMTLL